MTRKVRQFGTNFDQLIELKSEPEFHYLFRILHSPYWNKSDKNQKPKHFGDNILFWVLSRFLLHTSNL